jgi:hypothetical protein
MGWNGVFSHKVRFPRKLKDVDGSTSSQVIYSRLSDIFGRKILLVMAIAVFTVGNLLCGFSRNLSQLIAFRVIAGLGGGGIGVLVLIIISDISTLRTRGKVLYLFYQQVLMNRWWRTLVSASPPGRLSDLSLVDSLPRKFLYVL